MVLVRLLCLAVLLAGAFLRLEQLDRKPMHTDEAVQALKFGALLEQGEYTYDPVEYHGPTLYYTTLLPAWLRGHATLADTDERMLRVVPAMFGVLVIVLAWGLWKTAMPPLAMLVMLALLAFSPILVYYSRYYIQEMLMVAGAMGLAGCAWRWIDHPRLITALAAGLFLGWMHACKETFVISIAAMGAGFLCARPKQLWCSVRAHPRHVAGMLLTALVVSVLFFSSFGSNPRGVLDSVLTYGNYIGKAANNDHSKPWFYYLHVLAYTPLNKRVTLSEWPLLLFALVGLAAAIRWRRASIGDDATLHLARFAGMYSVALLGVYSVLDYKTPWLITNAVPPLALLAAAGVAAMQRRIPRVGAACTLLVLVIGSVHLHRQVEWTSTRWHSHERNPFAYSQTSTNLLSLVAQVNRLAQSSTAPRFVVKVAAPEYWPLPWYFRHLTHVGYYPSVPDDLRAHLIIAGMEWMDQIAPHLPENTPMQFFGLRPGRTLALFDLTTPTEEQTADSHEE